MYSRVEEDTVITNALAYHVHNVSLSKHPAIDTTYPGPVERKRLESRLKGVRKHHSLQSLLYFLSLIPLRLGTARFLLGTHCSRIVAGVSLVRGDRRIFPQARGPQDKATTGKPCPEDTMSDRMD